jgi:hypothetical protein
MAELTPINKPKNNTGAPKNNTGLLKNNLGTAPAASNVTANSLNKELNALLSNTTPKNNANAATLTNKPKNANATKNNIANLNNLNNLNNLSIPANATKNNNKNQIKTNENKAKENKKEEPGMVESGINKLDNTLSSIKNSVLGGPRANNQNKSSKNNKNKSSENKSSENKSSENKSNENKANEIREMVSTEAQSEGDSIWMTVIKVVIMVVFLVAIYYIGNYLITRYLSAKTNSPMLLNTTKSAKNAMVISQDPNSVNYIPILKSDGQDGIQFTYGFWFLIENVDYKKGEWKHVFHKGNSSSYPNRAPGVWFHPDKNSLRVYMNTQDNILEFADVDEIPVRKWIYMNVILNNKNLDIYINGYLKIRKELSSIPKQNDDDFWINMYGGFEGYLSNMRYYAYAVDFNEIYNNIKSGPSTNNCIDTGEVPPYMDDNWWFTYNG